MRDGMRQVEVGTGVRREWEMEGDATSATAVRVPRFLLLPAVSRPSAASVPQPSIIATVAYSLPSATRTTRVVPPGASNAAASSLPLSPMSAHLLLSAPADSTSAMAIPVPRWFLLLPAVSPHRLHLCPSPQ